MQQSYGEKSSFVIVWLIVFSLVVIWTIAFAYGTPSSKWDNSPSSIREWFRALMQPDNPAQSCCGEADAFEADDYGVEGDHYVAVITDGHGMIPNGTLIPVPNRKIKWDAGNPTGHGIIFLSGSVTWVPPAVGTFYVLKDGDRARILYCYVVPGGV